MSDESRQVQAIRDEFIARRILRSPNSHNYTLTKRATEKMREAGKLEALGLFPASPLYGNTIAGGVDETDNGFDVGEFTLPLEALTLEDKWQDPRMQGKPTPEPTPEDDLMELVYQRYYHFAEALSSLVGRKRKARDSAYLEELAQAIEETGVMMASTAQSFVDLEDADDGAGEGVVDDANVVMPTGQPVETFQPPHVHEAASE